MRNYFTYNNQYISGWRYFLRRTLQSNLYLVFGLGFYLLGVTSYARAKSLGHSNTASWFFALNGSVGDFASLFFVIAFIDTIEGIAFIPLIVQIIANFYLWFANGKPNTHNSMYVQDNPIYHGRENILHTYNSMNEQDNLIPQRRENIFNKVFSKGWLRLHIVISLLGGVMLTLFSLSLLPVRNNEVIWWIAIIWPIAYWLSLLLYSKVLILRSTIISKIWSRNHFFISVLVSILTPIILHITFDQVNFLAFSRGVHAVEAFFSSCRIFYNLLLGIIGSCLDYKWF